MDESAITRALYIAVGLTITVITVSAIIAYYNIARSSIKDVGSGTNFDTLYREDIQSTLLSTGTDKEITGTQVKNLINYYYLDLSVEILVSDMKYINEDGDVATYSAISISSDEDTRTRNYHTVLRHLTNNQHFTLEKTENNGIMSIRIKGA